MEEELELEIEVLKKALRRALKWMNANEAPQDICDEAQIALQHRSTIEYFERGKAAQHSVQRTCFTCGTPLINLGNNLEQCPNKCHAV